jgi:hypothetical protein
VRKGGSRLRLVSALRLLSGQNGKVSEGGVGRSRGRGHC